MIFLKESIDSILAIDRKTRELVENTDKEIEQIKKDLIEKSKLLGKEKSDEILSDFEKKADDLRKENQKNLEEIEAYYEETSEDLIKVVFDKLIGRDSNV